MELNKTFTVGVDRIYLSGPISGRCLQDNLDRFKKLGDNLTELGHIVYNPACLDQELDYDEMMRRDFRDLTHCTHILMLPGWTASKGACAELLMANQMKLKVRYLLPDMETVVVKLLDCTALKGTMLETIADTVISL